MIILYPVPHLYDMEIVLELVHSQILSMAAEQSPILFHLSHSPHLHDILHLFPLLEFNVFFSKASLLASLHPPCTSTSIGEHGESHPWP